MDKFMIQDKGHSTGLMQRPAFTSYYNGKQYYSGIDAEIYFNDTIYIDEIVQIAFQVDQNTMPLFGYNSYIYDDLATGSRLIQGSFAINFTEANYLYNLIESLEEVDLNAAGTNVSVDDTDIDESGMDEDTEAEEPAQEQKPQEKRPLWHKKFSILFAYGTKKKYDWKSQSNMIELLGVQLTGCSQQFDSEGNPIIELYSFIARDIKYI